MSQSIRVETAQKNKRLIAYFIDFAIIAVGTVGFFFLLLYLIIGPMFNYKAHCNNVYETREKYHLNLGKAEYYTRYIEGFQSYFEDETLTDKIVEYAQRFYPEFKPLESKTNIEKARYAYNVLILDLPVTITQSDFKTDYYIYPFIPGSMSEYDLYSYGVMYKDLNEKVKANLRDFFSWKLETVNDMLIFTNPDYKESLMYKANVELSSRVISIGLSVIVFYIVIPSILKNGVTIGSKIAKVGFVNNKNGYKMGWYKNIFRALALYALPIFGFGLFDRYGTIIFIIFPLFISILMMLFKESGRDLADVCSRTMSVDLETSVLFKSAGEARIYEKKEENQKITDPDFLKALESVQTFDFNEPKKEEKKTTHKKK